MPGRLVHLSAGFKKVGKFRGVLAVIYLKIERVALEVKCNCLVFNVLPRILQNRRIVNIWSANFTLR